MNKTQTEISMQAVTNETILSTLRKAGVEQGDVLFVHSAMRPFGLIDGGATTVAEALIEAVGESGTVAAPAFCFVHEIQSEPIIDPANDPSEMGAISEAIRRLPGAKRSAAFRHSISAVGRHAEFLTNVDHKLSVFHMESSFGRMYALNAKIVLIGVEYVNSTSHHFAEFVLQVQDRHTIEQSVILRHSDGTLEKTVMTDYQPKPNPSGAYYSHPHDFNKSGLMLEKAGKVGIASAGNAMIRVFRMRDLINLLLRTYPLDDMILNVRDGEKETVLPDGVRTVGAQMLDGAGRPFFPIWSCVDPNAVFKR